MPALPAPRGENPVLSRQSADSMRSLRRAARAPYLFARDPVQGLRLVRHRLRPQERRAGGQEWRRSAGCQAGWRKARRGAGRDPAGQKGPRLIELVALALFQQGLAADAEHLGALAFAPAMPLQHGGDIFLLDLLQGLLLRRRRAGVQRQVARDNLVAVVEEGALEQVAQFPHVAWKIVVLKRRQRLRR